MNLFNELVYNFDHEGWNEYDLPKLKLAVVLLNWREKARSEGRKFFDEQVRLTKATQAQNPQLFLPL